MKKEFWKCSGNAAEEYINICKMSVNDDSIFNKFKSLRGYRRILEHCNEELGMKYYIEIKENNPNLLEHINKFTTNDLIGTPFLCYYDFKTCSATTLRYMYVLSDLILKFNSLDSIDIVEIGGGYGGQCKIIKDLFSPRKYVLADIPEALELQKKYLSKFDIDNIIFADEEYIKNIGNVDLIISNYALSELNEAGQNFFYDNIIKKSKMGYITSNSDLYFVDKLNRFKNTLIEKDISSKNSNIDESKCRLSWGFKEF